MDIIHLLPDNVANQIAAGEVIQRPASCLKELVENSLDAGATRISVLVRDAGRTSLQVIDDGKGMSMMDARMAFERHATSKIRDVNDLFTLRTMGFRGEALPSICAVSQIELQTRRQEDEVGTRVEIHGSELISQEPCQCPVGTNMRVRNLFYNVPARRKFLKTDQTELRNLLTEFYHIVLVYPHVQFTFVSNDEILLDLPSGSEKQRIEQIFGRTNRPFTTSLVDVKTDTELVSIRGFVGKPESANKTPQQYFFVNGRYMRHAYFHKAVQTAYSGMLPGEMSASYFIYFDINPERIDVNIHPTKTEIKFADEQAIFQILLAAVRESLGKFNVSPSLDFNREGEWEMPTRNTSFASISSSAAPKVVFDPNYNPFRSTKSVYQPSVRESASQQAWQVFHDNVQGADTQQLAVEDLNSLSLLEGSAPYQYADKFIFQPSKVGLLIINQHRAHVCVLYYQILSQLENHQALSQKLLFPELWEVDSTDTALVDSLLPDLRAVGFDIEQLSPACYSIQATPAIVSSENAISILQDVLAAVRETNVSVHDSYSSNIALSLAKSGAIPYGKNLTQDEQRDLVQRLLALPSYRVTPDGKRVISILADEELSKRF